jgi:AraC-like DNA-binding protein
MSLITVANVSTRAILEVCARRKVDVNGLLANAGVSRALFENPNARIAESQMRAVWEEAQRRNGEEMIALYASSLPPFGAYRVLDYLIVGSSTLADALNRTARYFHLVNTGISLRVRARRDRIHVEFHSEGESQNILRQYVEYTFACIWLRFRSATGVNLLPKEVHFRHPEPVKSSEYHRVFQSPVRFNHRHNQVILDRKLLETPLPQSDPLLCEALDHYAQRMLKQLPVEDDIADDVRQVLRMSLRSGDIHISTVAKKLALSSRSLQRKLLAQGTSYRELLDHTRYELSTDLLRQQVDVQEITFSLGFSEPGAFYRAFKKWTGKTPQEFSKRHPR